MATIQNAVYSDFAEFIAGLSPEKLLAYYAPPKMQRCVEILVEQKKERKLTDEEVLELEKYFLIKHIVRLAKAKALKLKAIPK